MTRPRVDAGLPQRLARSAAASEGARLRTDGVAEWLAERLRAHRFRVDRIPFADLDGWMFAPGTGDLVHHSGRFFSVEGVGVTVAGGPVPSWQQPIIHQPEVGILGILAKEIDGVLHFLMQAKMEPGNRNLLQLSPTVQATRSNYTKVHKGSDVRYLEYFVDPRRGRVLADVLQSEHGSWFLRKANRNVLVETDDDVPPHEDFRWLTLGQIGRLLRLDNLVNMDSRTVLAGLPTPSAGDTLARALHTDLELLSWITAQRARHEVRVERLPLAGVRGWHRTPNTVERPDGRYFRVVAVAVEAGSREVTGWTQPLVEPAGRGVTAFLTRRIGGVPHLLVHARVEAGLLDVLELAPTVQYTPENYAHLDPADRPPFLAEVLAAEPRRIRYEAVHSEEGGRFLDAESRYLIVEADPDAPAEPPEGYLWITPGQLGALARHARYVNVQARTLLACINSGAIEGF
ncbi:NDP-hexose 2,3-dehydratase family protein [Streptomyces sp. NBC_00094]|uniref:NDP-hexose 2,3-dehydratase family protein n=1 Tax=Streptomyces sp. NBC_00094 TaxID=2903620 RepID=UPI00225A679A|nr:NDP-hexose 2,3-dehydratase family protein [Streptomyces sp. NBC_00094]MCX5393912.1 NDP-hexose 2,3-dehydratase family protein [Streptomyces sp. NBC_00094]